MLQELRTGSLTPKNYYQLYMAVFDELRVLQEALVERFGGEPVVGVGAGADGGGGNGSGNDEKDDKRNDDDDQLYRRGMCVCVIVLI